MRKSARRRAIEEVRPPTLAEVCAHEAGHAIVQLATGPGGWIEYIEVDNQDEGRLGVVWSQAEWQPWMRDEQAPPQSVEHRRRAAARDVVNYLAGNVAEFRFRGRPRSEIKFGCVQMADACIGEPLGSRTDYGLARNRLEWIAPDSERNGFMHAWLAAESIVASWWSEILLLAGELERRGRLTDTELYPLWNDMRDARTKQALAQARRTADWLPRHRAETEEVAVARPIKAG